MATSMIHKGDGYSHLTQVTSTVGFRMSTIVNLNHPHQIIFIISLSSFLPPTSSSLHHAVSFSPPPPLFHAQPRRPPVILSGQHLLFLPELAPSSAVSTFTSARAALVPPLLSTSSAAIQTKQSRQIRTVSELHLLLRSAPSNHEPSPLLQNLQVA